MAEPPPNLDSLYLTALEIESPEERAAFLTRSCGADESLRKEIERRLASHQAAGSLLETPAAELAATLVPSAPGQDLAASLQAGLAPAFRAGEAVVIGHAGLQFCWLAHAVRERDGHASLHAARTGAG